MLQITYDQCLVGLKKISFVEAKSSGNEIRNHVEEELGSGRDVNFYLVHNGSIVETNDRVPEGNVHVLPRLVGGKGGFGSMLRAIGAQIEKTTNREACRDLSGRRLRDINEEKRLKKWIAEQSGRDEEQSEKRKRKIEKLAAEPKHEFNDADYDKVRSEMPDKVHDAVEQGLKASNEVAKNDQPQVKPAKAKPKGSLWFDIGEDLADVEDSDSEEEKEDEEDGVSPAKKLKASCSA